MPPVADRDLLVVSLDEDLATDEFRLLLYSRYFDWRGGVRFTRMIAPPEQAAVQMCLAAFGPLFRAYSGMPFSMTILRQLLAATMDRLLPHIYEQLTQLGEQRRHTARLFADVIEYAGRYIEIDLDGVWREAVQAPAPPQHTHTGAYTEAFLAARERLSRSQQEQILAHVHAVEQTLFFNAPCVERTISRAAIERARETLLHCLSPVQRAEFERDGRFTVVAQNNQLFTIHTAEAYNVSNDDFCYCALPTAPCPVYDKMLASKLWLEADYNRFMAVANRKRLRGGPSAYVL